MYISYIDYPVTTLGPGKRIGIWTSGCLKNCKGCMSPLFKDFDEKKKRDVSSILKEIKEYIDNNHVDGITISGGEPFLQDDLFPLVKGVRELGIEDILVYTGFLIDELEDKIDILNLIGVLIDGPYVEELNDDYPLRGSSNQKIYILNSSLKSKYQIYLLGPRSFDVKVENDQIIIIGLLPKDGPQLFEEILKTKK